MDSRKDGRLRETPAGGLLNRRALLRGALALPLATPVLAQVDDAAADRAPWMKAPGEPMRSYGSPAPQEASVARKVFAEYGSLTPGAGVSFTPLESLRGTLTPNGLHFERHHSGVPAVDPSGYRLFIHGAVGAPQAFSHAALEQLPLVSRLNFLECSGNSFWNAIGDVSGRTCGELHGLLSSSEWTGIELRRLLGEVRPKPEARWLIAEGGDAARMVRSIPLDLALERGMLALYQNGERLRPEQGYPARLFFGGLEGNVSVKWVRSLVLSTQPAQARDETSKYSDERADGSISQFTLEMGVKSLLISPCVGTRLPRPGVYELEGIAWSGAGKIRKVEISADGGATWSDAELDPPHLAFAPVRFRLPWVWRGQRQTLVSRATDESGAVQPTHAEWKSRYASAHIYHYNALQFWRVDETGAVQAALS